MESIYIDNVMWVKNGKRVRFGFCLKSEKENEIREKNLEISIAIFLSIPGHHENITVSDYNRLDITKWLRHVRNTQIYLPMERFSVFFVLIKNIQMNKLLGIML